MATKVKITGAGRGRITALAIAGIVNVSVAGAGEPVDYVNPYIGNISHILEPTYATVSLPNSMLRMVPCRKEVSDNLLYGLPITIAGHRGSQTFVLNLFSDSLTTSPGAPEGMPGHAYDLETIKPYEYGVYLTDLEAHVRFAPSRQSAVYSLTFDRPQGNGITLTAPHGELTVTGRGVGGYHRLYGGDTRIYIYMESVQEPVVREGSGTGCVRLEFAPGTASIDLRYGISFISAEQARANLIREVAGLGVDEVASKGRKVWNEALSKISVTGGTTDDKVVFYTSLYRFYERMICISEDGRYYSGYDGRVHDDEGVPFYVDDWLWDTYRAAHPLRTIIDPEVQVDMVNSFIRMAEQMDDLWMPTFPEVVGDTRRMNSNHGVAVLFDCYNKGLRGFDLAKGYLASKKAVTEKTLAPWSGMKAGALDEFYRENGYFPALAPGEKETAPEVEGFEKRQPVAVTLGTVYDEWCLGRLAGELGLADDSRYFVERSRNYRKVFNPDTRFFHPRDAAGNFIEPFDYRYSGGAGAREAYDENNGWVYRWDVPHDVAGLISLMGGPEEFIAELERMYSTPLGKSKYDFYSTLPDHTGNVGQFSMGNEPAMHVPYLYNYAGAPWRTQKRVRELLSLWFRNDLMGVPGDEDGGGLSAFVVFSQLGFYPVTPGMPMYVIGSPVFEKAEVDVGGGKKFTVLCRNYSPDNKYIRSATLDGQPWDRSWFPHEVLAAGGTLELEMSRYPNKEWASGEHSIPPSFIYEPTDLNR